MVTDISDITQIIDESTRGPNLLDLIFIFYNNNIIESGTYDPRDPSLDHDLVFVSISTHKNNCYKRQIVCHAAPSFLQKHDY